MGDSNYTSNIVGDNITASGFTKITAAAFVGNITVTTDTGYYKIGDHLYIFGGALNTEASIVAAATAIDASVKGSMYLSMGGGYPWVFDSDTAATRLS